jgi:RNA polymerase sigma-70 factor, ECF subfamily
MAENESKPGDLLIRWRNGDQQAAKELFERYAAALTAVARRNLSAKLRHRIDPEEVVQSACRSFFLGALEDRYELSPGADLWRLLVAITLNKLHLRIRFNTAQKRAIDRERCFGTEDSLLGIQADLTTPEASPVDAAALADELEQIMSQLEPLDRQVLELRLQGYDLHEISDQVQRSQRTVRRTLDEIKQLFAHWNVERPQ